MLEYDPMVVEFLHLICSRAIVSEAIKAIPAKEQPSRDILEGYVQTTQAEEDLAWSEDLFVPLVAWLHDREVKRKRREIEQSNFHAADDIGRFNFRR